jgi:predicted PurR-regulated permease PerM
MRPARSEIPEGQDVRRPDNPRALIAWTIVMLVLTVALVWALFLVRHVLLLIYVSTLLAIGFSPLIRFIERQKVLGVGSWRLPHWLAILSVYVVILSTATGIGFAVFPPLVHQAQELWTRLPDMFGRAQHFLVDHHVLNTHVSFAEIVQQAPGSSDAFGTILVGFWGLLGGVFGVVTILILTFYLLIESEALFRAVLQLFPTRRQAQVRAVSREITVKVSSWLSAQFVLAAFIGLTTVIGLGVMGIPYFYVLALIAAVGELIPIVGPILAAIPGIAVALTMSWKMGAGVAVYYLIQQQFESNILVPKLMERQVGLSAAAVIVALLVGGSLLGILGAILSVPTAAVLQVVFQEVFGKEGNAA